MLNLYGDFETTTIDTPIDPKTGKKLTINEYLKSKPLVRMPEVYSWCLLYEKELKIENEKYDEIKNVYYVYGIDIFSFLVTLIKIKENVKIWFNNSKGFDAHFIKFGLDKLGYQTIPPLVLPDSIKNSLSDGDLKAYEKAKNLRISKFKKIFVSKYNTKNEFDFFVKKNWNKPFYKEYTMLVNNNKNIYSLTFGNSTFDKKGFCHSTTIADNLLLFPTSIEKMGETLVKEYVNNKNWDEQKAKDWFCKKTLSDRDGKAYQKYDVYNSLEELENDGNELEYLIQDCYTLYAFQNIIDSYFPREMWKMTIGATAYAEWQNVFGSLLLTNAIAKGYVKILNYRNGFKKYVYQRKSYLEPKIKKILIENMFPTSWLDEIHYNDLSNHDMLYRFYDGGLTQPNEDFRGKLTTNVANIDVNSSYPASMFKEIPLPYGIPVYGDKWDHNFKFYKITILNEIKNETGVPFIHSYNQKKREYQTVLKQGDILYINSYTFDRFNKFYLHKKDDVYIEVLYSFKTLPMKSVFECFIDKWYTIKEEASKAGNEVLKLIAKLFLNSLYGKFGTKKHRISFLWNVEEQMWNKIEEDIDSNFYLPIGACITSASVLTLVDAIDHNFKNVLYMDTDSIFIKIPDNIIKKEDTIDWIQNNYKVVIDKSILGEWDLETQNMLFYVRRSKQYFGLMWKNGKIKKKYAFAGINFNRIMTDEHSLQDVEENIKIFENLEFEDFVYGKDIENQTKPVRLPEGIFIDTIEKRIRPVWEYDPLEEQTMISEKDYIKEFENNKYLIDEFKKTT